MQFINNEDTAKKQCLHFTDILNERFEIYNVGKKAEENTRKNEYSYNASVSALVLVNLKKHQKSRTRACEKSREHSAEGYEA